MSDRTRNRLRIGIGRDAREGSTSSQILSGCLMAILALAGLPLGSVRAQLSADQVPPAAGEGVGPVIAGIITPSKMSDNSFAEMQARSTTGNYVKAARPGETSYFVFNVEFRNAGVRKTVFTDTKASTIPNAHVLTVIDRFADVFISSDSAWKSLYSNPDVVRAELAATVTAPPPPKIEETPFVTQAVPETIVRGGYKGLTGKNVNIAILDTGIDFRHPDFARRDEKGPISRLKYFWDTSLTYKRGRGQPAPFTYPNGAPIGTLFTREQLTEELRSGKDLIPPTDERGHGTACASIAAGNGNADTLPEGLKRDSVKGVAPDADIIGVRMGPAKDDFANSFMIGAVMEWLDKTAGNQPLVVSGSFGSHGSAHDGQSVEERQLDQRFPLTGVSRAVVFAAGNEGGDPIHASLKFGAESKTVVWRAERRTKIDIYFNAADRYHIYGIYGTDQSQIRTENTSWELNPITNQYHARITVAAGIGTLWIKNDSGGPGEADLYFGDRSLGSFLRNFASYGNLVGSPGTTGNALTIGSYDWNDSFHREGAPASLGDSCTGTKPIEIGWLSCYSSPGPRRNFGSGPAVFKPEIISPGEYYPSANAKVKGETVGGTMVRVDTTGNYRLMNGTSAATPYTAGIVALMFQKKPTLTLGEVRTLLKMHATKTGLTPNDGAIPNKKWGYGKLDMAAIDRIFTALEPQQTSQ